MNIDKFNAHQCQSCPAYYYYFAVNKKHVKIVLICVEQLVISFGLSG